MCLKTNIYSSSDKNGMTKTTFQETPIMSTYLIAFVISDFANLSSPNGYYRTFSKPSAINSTKMALVEGEKILDGISNYLGINYNVTMPKMDQISIPQFSAGAMENWGLVTYRCVFVNINLSGELYSLFLRFSYNAFIF